MKSKQRKRLNKLREYRKAKRFLNHHHKVLETYEYTLRDLINYGIIGLIRRALNEQQNLRPS